MTRFREGQPYDSPPAYSGKIDLDGIWNVPLAQIERDRPPTWCSADEAPLSRACWHWLSEPLGPHRAGTLPLDRCLAPSFWSPVAAARAAR